MPRLPMAKRQKVEVQPNREEAEATEDRHLMDVDDIRGDNTDNAEDRTRNYGEDGNGIDHNRRVENETSEDERNEYERNEYERNQYESDEYAGDDVNAGEVERGAGEDGIDDDERDENETDDDASFGDELSEHISVEYETDGHATDQYDLDDLTSDEDEAVERVVGEGQEVGRVLDEDAAVHLGADENEAVHLGAGEDEAVHLGADEDEAVEGGAQDEEAEMDLLTDEEAEGRNEGPSQPLFQGIGENDGLNLHVQYKDDITGMDLLLQTLAMGIRFGHSYENIIVQLNWINGSLQNSNLPTTKEQLWKLLGRDKQNTVCRLYCSMCKEKVAKGSKPTRHCTCGRCGPGKYETYVSTFIQIRLGPQLEQLLKLPNMAESLRYKLNRMKIDLDGIEDIYDGELYKRLEEGGQFLSNPYNFSLTLWTDGVQLTKSSKSTAYPVLLQLNELHPYARKKHLLMAGIWVGRGSPGVLTTILLPVVRDVKMINDRGVTWEVEGVGEVTTRFVVIIFTADSIARPNACRMTQFNGKFGCTTCLAPGELIQGSGNVRVYPAEVERYALRTDRSIREDGVIAYAIGRSVNGVKGCSALASLPQFDLVDGVVVDVCHMAYEGVAKQWLQLVLTTVNTPYYIGQNKNLKIIDKRLLSIKTPSRISRPPRSITESSTWKASEWRNWVEYYSLPCLSGILPPRYLHHWRKFVQVVFILNKYSITAAELDEAETLVTSFMQDFQELFGLRNMSFNLHLFSHSVLSVRNWGPLLAYSTFPFESFNQNIVQAVTSPHCRAEQIITRFLMRKFIVQSMGVVEICERTEDEIEKLLNASRVNVPQGMTEGHYFVGQGKTVVRRPTADELQLIRRAGYLVAQEIDLTVYKKAIIHGVKYLVTDDISRKTCDFIVFSSTGFWKICSLVRYGDEENAIFGFIGEKMVDRGSLFGTNYMRRITATQEKAFVSYHHVIVPGISIRLVGGNICAVPLSNSWEMD